MIYYIIYFVLGSLALLNMFEKKKHKGVVLIFVVTLTLLAGLRYRCGVDYYTYLRAFNGMQSGTDSIFYGQTEFLFRVIFKLAPYLWLALLFVSVIVFVIRYRTLVENTPYLLMTLFVYYSVYFLYYDMGLMRQGMSMAIALYSIKYIKQRDIKKFLIAMFMGFLCHRAILLFIPAYFFAEKKWTRVQMVGITIGSFAISLLPLSQLFAWLLEFIPYGSRYVKYLDTNNFSLQNLLRLAILMIFIFLINEKDEDTRRMVNIYAMGTWMYYAFMSIYYVSNRGTAFYLVVQIFLWPKMIKSMRGSFKKTVAICMVLVYTFYYFYQALYLFTEDTYANAPLMPYQITNFLE